MQSSIYIRAIRVNDFSVDGLRLLLMFSDSILRVNSYSCVGMRNGVDKVFFSISNGCNRGRLSIASSPKIATLTSLSVCKKDGCRCIHIHKAENLNAEKIT